MNRDLVGFFVSVALLFFGYMGINQYLASKEVPPAPVLQANEVRAPEGLSSSAPQPQVPPETAATAAAANEPVALETPAPAAAIAEVPAELLRLELETMQLDFTQTGACLGPVLLKQYKETSQKDSDQATLRHNYSLCKGFGARIAGVDLRDTISSVEKTGPQSIRFVQRVQNFEVIKNFDFSAGAYRGVFELQVRNTTAANQNTTVGIELGATSEKQQSSFFSGMPQAFEEAAYYADETLKRELLAYQESPTKESILSATGIRPEWVSSGSLYFVIAMLPRVREPINFNVDSTGFNIQKNRSSPADRTVYEAWIDQSLQLGPNETKSVSYDIYVGPKLKESLDAFETQKLQKVIDYGFFEIVAWPIFYALKSIFKVVGNWGIAIIILTVALKMLFYPLTLKAYLASKKMQKLQPQLNELKEKYKDDRQKQSQEMMAIMSQGGANPMSGCLPVLPQIPVFFALFQVFQHSFELRHANFGLWIHDLSAMDPYYALPVIMAVMMFFQSKLTPMPAMDPAQQKMMQFMPVLFALFMFSFPSGLVLYSLTNTTMTLIQQQYMIRKHKDA